MEKKSYNFSSITFSDLEDIVNVRMGNEQAYLHKFDEWFGFAYSLSDSENFFLEKLIKKHYRLLPSYQEEDLKMKF
ncbi:MAG: hypothetical protein EAZ97_10855, partial [Bacteroidetes bacterium]